MHAMGGVSIPFNRESLSKENATELPEEFVESFQFPSNGKAYPKTLHDKVGIGGLPSFHSLQPGKPIQSAKCNGDVSAES